MECFEKKSTPRRLPPSSPFQPSPEYNCMRRYDFKELQIYGESIKNTTQTWNDSRIKPDTQHQKHTVAYSYIPATVEKAMMEGVF
jgi:hypothetical protein